MLYCHINIPLLFFIALKVFLFEKLKCSDNSFGRIRIRTYNFPQGRVSDHRINLTLYKLDSFLDGDIDEMIDALITVDQTEKMASI